MLNTIAVPGEGPMTHVREALLEAVSWRLVVACTAQHSTA
jgi:hypothetical protein